MRWRRWMLLAHRWLGLASSVVLTTAGATGAILVWPTQNLIHRIAGPVHERLALDRVGLSSAGWWIVVLATAAAVLLQLSGLVLWWKRRNVRVRFNRGLVATLDDLHHAVGAIGFVTMFVLALSGIAMAVRVTPELRKVVFVVHTSKELPIPVKMLYTLTTLGFAIQGVTGVVMWWRGRPGARG